MAELHDAQILMEQPGGPGASLRQRVRLKAHQNCLLCCAVKVSYLRSVNILNKENRGTGTWLSDVTWTHAWLLYSHCNLIPLIYVLNGSSAFAPHSC